MTQSANVTAECPRCGSTGESYNDGAQFERVHYGHHGPATKCLTCGGTF